MKKIKFFLLLLAISSSNLLSAQTIDLQSPANNLKQQITSIFPIVAGILFLVVALVNLGHFTKEGGDWKKGVFNVILYCIIVGVIVGLYQYISSVSL